MASRSATAISILIAGALLEGCPPAPPPPGEGHELLNVVAGTVKLGGSKVYGEWTVVRDGTGIETRGTGGACLVQLAKDLGGPDKCVTGDYSGAIAGVTGWYGYAEPGSAPGSEPGSGTCWVKPPTPRACNRTPDYLPNGPKRWEISGTNPYRSNLDFLPLAGPNKPTPGTVTHWRVIACLNGYNDDTAKLDSRDCGVVDGPNRLERWGDAVQIKVPPPIPLPDLESKGILPTGTTPPPPLGTVTPREKVVTNTGP